MTQKKLTYKQWLQHFYNLSFEVYMETESWFKDKCHVEYQSYKDESIKKPAGKSGLTNRA